MLRRPLRQSGCQTKGCAYSSRGARWEGKKKRALVSPLTPQPVMGMLHRPRGVRKPGFEHLPGLSAVELMSPGPRLLVLLSCRTSVDPYPTPSQAAPTLSQQGFEHLLGLSAVRLLSAHLAPASWHCSLAGQSTSLQHLPNPLTSRPRPFPARLYCSLAAPFVVNTQTVNWLTWYLPTHAFARAGSFYALGELTLPPPPGTALL